MQTIKVFKVETFGTLDGPGVRLVIFTQGCNFRCKYCHNPESWSNDYEDDKLMTAQDVVDLFKRYEPFYENGGITISGGEPLLHSEFIYELAQLTHQNHIHLAIDTSASTFTIKPEDYMRVIDLVNLWIVDIKATNAKDHEFITGCKDLTGMEFVKYLELNSKPYWIRQVIINGFNSTKDKLNELISFIKTLKHINKYELLSYHTLGLHKYNILNIDYPLSTIQVLSNQQFEDIKSYVDNQLKGK